MIRDKSTHKPWHKGMTKSELEKVYRINFKLVHDYDIAFVPEGYTEEWLLDQLHALDWYQQYSQEITEAEQKNNRPTATKNKRTRASNNPFK